MGKELQANVILVIVLFCWTGSAQRCSLHCGGGYQCALVRRGIGPPVMDCITFEEAQLLDQAYQGGRTGPVSGFGEGYFGRGVLPSRRFGGGRRFLHGGIGVLPSTGLDIIPDVGVRRPNVGVVNPGGVGPAVVEDRSRGLQLNLNIENNNQNQHSHGGSGGTQINTSRRGSAGVIPGINVGPGMGQSLAPGFGPDMIPGVVTW